MTRLNHIETREQIAASRDRVRRNLADCRTQQADLRDEIEKAEAAVDAIWREYLALAVVIAHGPIDDATRARISPAQLRLQKAITNARWRA